MHQGDDNMTTVRPPHPYTDVGEQIIQTCLRLEAMGYIIGTYGNVSARVPDGLLVTPSRVSYAELSPADMMLVSSSGEILAGHRLPSSETSVHRLIYNARSDVGAVLHTHSFYATALSTLHLDVPVIVEEQSQVVGDAIRCTTYVPAGQHEALGETVAQSLGESNGVLLANHGVVACGRNLEEAMFVAQVVERVAHMYLLSRAIAEPVPIPEQFVHSERERWLHKYGTSADRS